ncbi:hypothetical protein MKW92_017590 [Papaver armeniacum]|nr:hypothetical protein MKW92_017590 [Papaver armeniacum]
MRSNKSYQEIEDAICLFIILHNFPSRIAQIDETKVANPAAAFEKRINELREELLEVRGKLPNLSPEDWKKQFRNVQTVIYEYVYLLSIYPNFKKKKKKKEYISFPELKAKLEYGYAEAAKNYYNLEYTHLYALRKRAMMLLQLQLDLDSVNPPAFPLGEIPCLRQLLEDVDWKEILEYVDLRKGVLSQDPAKKNGKEVQSLEQTMYCDPIDFRNPMLVIDQFKEYEEEVNKAATEMDENFTVYVSALPVCKLVKKLDDDMRAKLSQGQSGQPVLKKQKH